MSGRWLAIALLFLLLAALLVAANPPRIWEAYAPVSAPPDDELWWLNPV